MQPDDETFKAAAAGAQWDKTPGYAMVLTDQPGKQSWPITGASFILMHKVQVDLAKGKEVVKFFDWAYRNGGAMALDLDYVPMPSSAVKLVQGAWQSELKDSSGKELCWPVESIALL